MIDRVTLATASGLPWLSLAFHVGTGLVAIVAGFLAMVVRKGGAVHRRSGLVFVFTMIATAITATGIAWYEGNPTAVGGALTAYLIFTALTAVRPLSWAGRRVEIGLMLLAFFLAAVEYRFAIIALGRPGHNIRGVPAGMMFFMATIVLLAALGDARVVHSGALTGSRRIARHLWRMSFGLFIASGSFFLGQMKFIPAPIRSVPLLAALAVSPLLLLLYWMWRVRLRQNLRGMITRRSAEATGMTPQAA